MPLPIDQRLLRLHLREHDVLLLLELEELPGVEKSALVLAGPLSGGFGGVRAAMAIFVLGRRHG
jgi:hypothetical protein